MKKASILTTIIIMTFLLTGCNGDVTRDIRHAGFNLSTTTFTCSDLMPKKESDTNYKKKIGRASCRERVFRAV